MSYANLIKEFAPSRGGNYSKKDLVDLAVEMFNDPECAIPVHVKKGDSFTHSMVNPGGQVRESVIAPILKSFGVDKAELERLKDVQISRAGGEAMANFSLLLVKQYVSQNGLGRKLILPMTSETESVQSISTTHVGEESRSTTMITRDADGSYKTTPTGKIVTTAAHDKLVTKNRVPAWLKTTKDAEKSA